MILPPASQEQTLIVKSVVHDEMHVRVHAVAGAGKTTTILHIASALPHTQSLLVLTYNAKLKSETRARCDLLRIKNVAVHTYHSAALNLYRDLACARDEGIAALLRRSRRPTPLTTNFTVLVIDEAQDMTQLYFSLTRRLLQDVCVPDVRIIVLGDARQSVYAFKGADHRFLTLADKLPGFASSIREWRHLTLTTSYRLAPRIASFVNSQLLEGDDILQSNHVSGQPPGVVRYLRCNVFGELPFQQITLWLSSGLAASDIFVLAPSIRVNAKQSPLRMLENRLVCAGNLCYAASSDDERLDEDVTRGKIVFATFHQVKGLERKAVLVFNFDASYHKFYERNPSGVGCPNPIYVAVTRAMQHLTLLHDSRQPPLRTIRVSHLALDCEFIIDGSHYKGGSDTVAEAKRTCEISVTELLRHQKQDALQAAMACIEYIADDVHEGLDTANTLLKSKINTGEDSWENVAAITGTAIPCMFEHQMTGSCTILLRAANTPKSLPDADRRKVVALSKTPTPLQVSDFLYIANVHITLTAGFTHKLRQIRSYDWVKSEDVTSMLDVMRQHVTGSDESVVYEHPASMMIHMPGRKTDVQLSCAIDCIDSSSRTSFEIKCVVSLISEHVLQTALNALLLENAEGGVRGYKHVLINLCDGSTCRVMMDSGVMKAAILLLEAKYADEELSDDLTFLDACSSCL